MRQAYLGLNLKGDNEKDPPRTKIIKQIILLIAAESVPERTKRKVAILNDIISCVRKEEETPAQYVSRFKSLTAKYAVQIGHIDYNTSCQMALTMLQNVKIPQTLQSNIFFQLSGKMRSDEDRLKSYVVDKSKIDSLVNYIEEFNIDLEPEESMFQHGVIEILRRI